MKRIVNWLKYSPPDTPLVGWEIAGLTILVALLLVMWGAVIVEAVL